MNKKIGVIIGAIAAFIIGVVVAGVVNGNDTETVEESEVTEEMYLELMRELPSFAEWRDEGLLRVAPAICGVIKESDWVTTIAIMADRDEVSARDSGAAARLAVEFSCPELVEFLPGGER